MTDPIVIEFEVGAGPEHAFHTWTDRCGMWWPPSHSVGQRPDFDVVFEARVGGRIYERTSDGTEHEWGTVTAWEPPWRLAYRWHIFLPPDRATDVTVSFSPTEGGTKVRLENHGFEIFGDAAVERVERVGGAWRTIVASYEEAVAARPQV